MSLNSEYVEIGPYKYTIEQNSSFDDIIVKIYYNGVLIEGNGLYGGTQRFTYDYTFLKPFESENDPPQSVKGILGVKQSILSQFETHNTSPRFYNSNTKEYYPPSSLSSTPTIPSSSNSSLPNPSTENISNSKGEVTLNVSSSNNLSSDNPYLYDIKPDFGYGSTTFNSTQKGWKIFLSYNGTLINFPPDGPILIDLSRNYDEAVEYIERLIRKTGFTDSAGVNYPPYEPPVPKAIIKAEGYETLEKSIIKGDGTVKEDLGIIQLTSTQEALEIDKIEAAQLDPSQLEKLLSTNLTPEQLAQKKLTDLITTLKQTAIPLALTLISSFGITKASKLIEQGKNKASDLKDQLSCPTSPELIKLISRKNKLVKQINNALKTIDNDNKILGITGNVLTVLELAFRILKNLPIPSSVPPGIGLPVNVILGIQDNKDKIDKTLTRLKTANAGLLTILVIVRQVLTQLLQFLSLLDSLIQECSPNNTETQEVLSSELIALTQQQSNQQSPVIINVNGFEIGVETESTTNSLKRRRAIARNKGGVVMLKGEWSFSSIDQILIDELVFYIQVNDLKAD